MNFYCHGVTVVIPCLDEAETVAAVVAEALRGIELSGLDGEVIVVDNGCKDDSATIAMKAGARVIKVSRPGYGSALNGGILAAKFRLVVTADADMSYPLLELKNLINSLCNENVQLVLGSRLHGQMDSRAMPFLNRRIATPFLSWLIRSTYKIQVSDCNSGMRALKRDAYESLGLKCTGMEFASEMLIRAGQLKWNYRELPISYRKHLRSHSSHLRRFRDGMRHLLLIIESRFSDASG